MTVVPPVGWNHSRICNVTAYCDYVALRNGSAAGAGSNVTGSSDSEHFTALCEGTDLHYSSPESPWSNKWHTAEFGSESCKSQFPSGSSGGDDDAPDALGENAAWLGVGCAAAGVFVGVLRQLELSRCQTEWGGPTSLPKIQLVNHANDASAQQQQGDVTRGHAQLRGSSIVEAARDRKVYRDCQMLLFTLPSQLTLATMPPHRACNGSNPEPAGT